ncbi:MAG: ArsR/SmtB family transcription factor [Vulcanimicrobiaceae bacterium]
MKLEARSADLEADPTWDPLELGSLLRILSDPTRLRILDYLAVGDCCVCEIVQAIGIPQPLLSHHLRVLRDNGFVRDRRNGRWMYYSVIPERLATISKFLAVLATRTAQPVRRVCS